MAYQVGDVIARIGLQVMTGQFNTASQAFRSLGYDAVFMGKQFSSADSMLGKLSKSMGTFSSNTKLVSGSIKGISDSFQKATYTIDSFGMAIKNGGFQSDKFEKSVVGLIKGIGGLTYNVTTLVLKLGLVAGAFATITTIGLAAWVYKVHSEFEALNVRLKYVTGTFYSAEKAMEWVKTFAKETPLDVQEVTDAFARLEEKGISATENLPKIVDAVIGVGGSEKQLNGIIYALTQMASLPKGIAQEFRQLANQGIDAISLLNNYFELNLKSAKDAVEYFGSGAKVAEAIMSAMGVKFEGIAKDMNQTMKGQLQEMGDNFWSFGVKIGENGVLGGIKSLVVSINDKFDEWSKTGDIDIIAYQISNILGKALKVSINLAFDLAKAIVYLGYAFNWTSERVFNFYSFLSGNNIDNLKSKIAGAKFELKTLGDTFGASDRIKEYESKLAGVEQKLASFKNSADMYKEALDGINIAQKNTNDFINTTTVAYNKNAREKESVQLFTKSLSYSLAQEGKHFNDLGQIVDKLGFVYDFNGKKLFKLKNTTEDATDTQEQYRKELEATSKIKFDGVISSFEYAFETFQFDFGGIISDFVNAGKNSGIAFTSAFADVMSGMSPVEFKTTKQEASLTDVLDSSIMGSLFENKGVKLATGGTATLSNIAGVSFEEDFTVPTTDSTAFNKDLIDYGKQIGVITDESEQLSIVTNKYQDMVKAGILTQQQANDAVDKFTTSQFFSGKVWSGAQAVGNAIGSNVGGAVSLAGNIATGNWGQVIAEGIGLMAANNPDMQEALDDINSFVGDIFGMMGKIFAPIFKIVGKILKKIEPLIIKIGDILGKIFTAFEPILNAIAEAVDPIAQILIYIGDLIASVFGIIDSVGNIAGMDSGSLIGGALGATAGYYGAAAGLTSITGLSGAAILASNPWLAAAAIGGGFLFGSGGNVPIVGDLIGGLFHDGGSVGAPFKYHDGASTGLPSGTFKSDEVPAVLQTGEIVLSRSVVGEAKRNRNSGGDLASTETQVLVKLLKEIREMRKEQMQWSIYGLPVTNA